ncbi:protein MODIFIER OF SNC1 1-like isoform X1 [Hibiscus syriacus]|uniref:protein MODIFIER OF SNC1 1-like isoform X1 n=1 Tax=Hibiscus syriacus TaxID=106335 RepID=UPI0019245E46|nr:protein MODIFIER OF SNC1 1-like isoform X1 [Hibiscus syriacus]XP_038999558.1 protein MODIFIER OF SNC1 1-like isoform X1 [Hibiscus syriacus]XP_038999559.1 protein MODIFIER OF SNC1 1-like isoform X1 [Hibiscus syriacus]
MTSSTLSGERRWASARRSGMTVLGKVAVPKPINLPSQRLENHGLDPNVEIVPKGTLSWGSKSSSSSNAWGSSTLSPNTDGGNSSPSHLSARPSSGGSGTRPSTAGSDRAPESTNARGSDSRPSSSSGPLASNQTSLASLRPRSAETRPRSSQLSRFAEPVPEYSGTWGETGRAEKLGMPSSKNDGFSPTSGDFPTLGSEKDTSGKNTELQEHGSQGRPGSSSEVAPMKERTGNPVVVDISGNENQKSGAAKFWRRENPPYSEDGVRPSMEKWHADPQGPHPFPNTGIHPQHYGAWHGPPINNHPGGVWYRGPPSGPPYGPPVPPGGFPLESFPYYRPQIPGSALPNPRPVPPGAGPRGPHPKNGDMYRGPMPDAFVRPGMPIRPSFYPGPVPYEGYYGPPMGYCNVNEREMPFMGIPAGPPYNRHPSQNAPDPGGSHARPGGGHGPPGKALAPQHFESGHPHDTRGPYKVLLKQHDGWEGKDEHRSEDTVPSVDKGDLKRTSSWENDWEVDQRKKEEVNMRTVVEEASTHITDHHGRDSISSKVKSSEGVKKARAYGDISAKKIEHMDDPGTTKDSSLFQKIESLNAKSRASDGQVAKQFANEVVIGSRAVPASGMTGPTSNEVGISSGDKRMDVPAVGVENSRRSSHARHGRTDHRGRERFNSEDVDGWRKKPPFIDSSNVKSTTHFENHSDANVKDHAPLEALEKSASYSPKRDEGELMPPVYDPSDNEAQRAMMRELAKQRAKQRQKEEEERARDQKAKALAKLEELNRRTQTAEGLTQKLEPVPDMAVQSKQEESRTLTDDILPSRSEITCLVSSSTIVADVGQSSTGELENTVMSNQQPLVSTRNAHKATAEMHNRSLPLPHADAALHDNPQVSDGSTLKQKHVDYRKKDPNLLDKGSSEKYITTELLNIHTDAVVDGAPSAEAVTNEIDSISVSVSTQNVVNTSTMHQKRKNNRSGKNKHKVEETLSLASLSSGISKEISHTRSSVEGLKPKSSECNLDLNSFQSLTESKDGNQSSAQELAFPHEEASGQVNNQWKSQQYRRMPRNPQAYKSAIYGGDAVVWAPVRLQNKTEVIEEVSHKSAAENDVTPQTKNYDQVQNNARNKRAEIERYIPKPVAKEMAQQVISQQTVAHLDNQIAADDIAGRAGPGSHGIECSKQSGTSTGTVGNTNESRNDGRQGRGHGSWSQRALAEPSLQDGLYTNPSKNAEKSAEQKQEQKAASSLVKEQPKYDEWDTSDGWNMPEYPDSTVSSVPVLRNQGTTGRGKRHPFKGQKGGGNNYSSDRKKINNGEADKFSPPSSVPEMVRLDSPAESKENRGVGDRSTSHWQPKSAPINQRGSRPDSDQNIGSEISRTNRTDSALQAKKSHQPQPDRETCKGVTVSLKDHVSEKGSVEAQNVGHHESKRERNVASLKGNPHSSNQGPGLPVEAPPSNMDTRNEQRTTTGFRRNGNQNNRYGRGHDSRGDWGSSGQEMKQQTPANRERQRHNSHYEYQPAGPQNNNNNNNRANNPEGPRDGSHGTGGRYRERGQSRPRRGGGNFHGRPSGTGGYE